MPKRDFSKMSGEELEAIFQANFGGQAGQQAQQVPQPQTDLQKTLETLKLSGLGQQSGGIRGNIADSMMVLGGGKPQDRLGAQSDLNNDIYKSVATEAIKNSMKSPLEQLIEQAKATEAAKTMGNRPLYDSLRGGQQGQVSQGTQQPQVVQDEEEFTGFEAPEIDPFTGKPTSVGLQQEYQNKLIQQKGIQDIKSKSPTAKQKDDLSNIDNVTTLLENMEKDAQNIPAGYSGLLSQFEGFITRGAKDTNTVVYNDQRKAVAVALYRALTGDTRLSDADAAARALPLLWKPDEAGQVRTMKFQKLKKLLSDRRIAVSQHLGGEENAEQLSEADMQVNSMLDQLGAE